MPDYSNLLIIAGGTNGLWVMDADPHSATNRVARIDDSGPSFPDEQLNNRYCNSLALVTLEDVHYVAATFAKKDASRVRFYALSDLRAALANAGSSETGHEIQALKDYGLKTHSSQLPRHPAQIYRSYVTDVVVDQDDPASDDATLYFSMLTDGLVKMDIDRATLLGDVGMPGAPTPPARVWGPVFGDSSFYATDPAIPHKHLYDNFNWVNQQGAVDVTERSDPPIFLSLALHRDDTAGGVGHKLYAAVEPLGWVQFDLADAWGPSMPIRHHEGIEVSLVATSPLTNDGAWPETLVIGDPLPATGRLTNVFDYARSIEVIETPLGWHVAFTSGSTVLLIDPPAVVGGFAYDDRFQWGGVTYNGPMLPDQEGKPTVRIFKVADLAVSPSGNPAPVLTPTRITIENGSERLFIPPVQSNILDSVDGNTAGIRLEYLHSSTGDAPAMEGRTNQVCLASVRIDTPATPELLVATRSKANTYGVRSFGYQPSLKYPNILMTCVTDGTVREGIPYLMEDPVNGEHTLESNRDAGAPGGNDRRFASGVTQGKQGQWLQTFAGPPAEELQCMASSGVASSTAGELSQVSVQRVTFDPVTGAPMDFNEARFSIQTPPDRWNLRSRASFFTATVDTEYDAYFQQFAGAPMSTIGPDDELVFFALQNTPDGIAFGKRNEIMALIGPTPLGGTGSILPSSSTDPILKYRLNTHPEFDGFPSRGEPDADIAKAWMEQTGSTQPYRSRIKTFSPTFARVQGALTEGFDGWVLAAPCGVAVLPSVEAPNMKAVTNTDYDSLATLSGGTDPLWFPTPTTQDSQNFERGLVQLWDFTNPVDTLARCDTSPPATGEVGSSLLPRIYLPIASQDPASGGGIGRSSFAWHLEVLEKTIDGDNRTFLFVGDFIGGVHCYEITDILKAEPPNTPILCDSWYPPLSLMDDLTNSIRALDLDGESISVNLYVAVQRLGVQVLEIDFSSGAPQFQPSVLLSDAAEPVTMSLDVRPSGERLLYVCDHRRGLSVYTSAD
ncbi:hypothetical protein [Planctomycetes bacterium Poly30]